MATSNYLPLKGKKINKIDIKKIKSFYDMNDDETEIYINNLVENNIWLNGNKNEVNIFNMSEKYIENCINFLESDIKKGITPKYLKNFEWKYIILFKIQLEKKRKKIN